MAVELQEPNVSGYKIEDVLASLKNEGFTVSTYVDVLAQSKVLSRIVHNVLDFLYCETQTGFLATRWATKFWFQWKKNPLLPLVGTTHLKMFYFIRDQD